MSLVQGRLTLDFGSDALTRYFGIANMAGSIVLFNSTFFTVINNWNCPPKSMPMA
jgi:hypothetical protein